jgi:signal transduction histidine kinase
MNRIFTHGFTTKPSGHGYGLHSSAILAKQMEGSLNCVNLGLGIGAEFTLILPYKIKKN